MGSALRRIEEERHVEPTMRATTVELGRERSGGGEMFGKLRMPGTLGLLSLAMVALVACGGSGGGEGGEKVTLTAGHQLANDTPFDKGLNRFAKLVDEKTDGQVEVQVQPNAQLGDEPEMFQAMQEGTQDVAVVAPGSIGEFAPEINILALPFQITSREQRDTVINGEVGDRMSKLLEEDTGVRIIGYFGGGVRNMFFTEPAESQEDIQGRLFRVQPSDVLTKSFGAVGLEPTVVDYTELYNALEQGVVDGAENESVFVLSQKFYEPAPHLLLTEHEVTIRPLMLSTATLDRLSEEQVDAVLEAGTEASEYERRIEAEEDDAALQTLQEEHDVTATKVDKAPMIKAVDPVATDFAEEYGLEDVLQQIQDARTE